MGFDMKTISENAAFGGTQGVYSHDSEVCGGEMTFAVYLPPAAKEGPVPVLWYLSGLTCTHENAMVKAGAQGWAAEAGIALVFPDTSPRGEGVADDEAYDLGQGAGFYVDATQSPWTPHFNMWSYVADELPKLVFRNFDLLEEAQGITGHSMGGHGAITLHQKHPDVYKSCSAFSPITSPARVPWGQKAFTAYLGAPSVAWEQYDATELVKERQTTATILVDTGTADPFLAEQLKPEIFTEACEKHGQRLDYNMREGYGHDYYFIATYMDEHIAHHAMVLED